MGLIFPVLWPEPFGVALIEALYFGVPVFGTPYGSLPEIVSPEVGVLSDSPQILGEAARDWSRFDRKAIHHYWQKHFTAEEMAKKYLAYYTSILDGQNLHKAPIISLPVRVSAMLPWRKS
jgi:glycosyltransferase involved in cell wall biosynthesis